MKVDNNKLKELSEPLIKWLNDELNPHVMVVVTPTSVELFSGECAEPITKYVRD